MLSWWAAADMRGVVMQLAQSMVGKTLDRAIILPPMLGLSLHHAGRCSPVGQVQGGLQAGDAGADDEDVRFHVLVHHAPHRRRARR